MTFTKTVNQLSEGKMKLTNKILLVFFFLLLVAVLVYKIEFNSRVELVPRAYGKEIRADKKTYLKNKFSNEYEFNGRFFVILYNRDSMNVSISGPDNLVNNYMQLVQEGNKISISSKIDLSKYWEQIQVHCFVKDVKNIRARGGAIIAFHKFTGDSLKIAAEDSAIVSGLGNKYLTTDIGAKDQSMILLSKTKNASIRLQDSSNVSLTLDGGEISGTVDDGVDFGMDGIIKKNMVEKLISKKNQQGGKK